MKKLPAISYKIAQSNLVRYAGASGDFNELHIDPQSTKERGYNNVIAHGMYIMGLSSNAILQWFSDSKLKYIKVRFQSAVYPGDKLTINGQWTEKDGCTEGSIEIKDSVGQIKLIGNFELKNSKAIQEK